jgi:hypothetical protein
LLAMMIEIFIDEDQMDSTIDAIKEQARIG